MFQAKGMIPSHSFLTSKIDPASADNDDTEDLAPCWRRLLVAHVQRGPTKGGGIPGRHVLGGEIRLCDQKKRRFQMKGEFDTQGRGPLLG